MDPTMQALVLQLGEAAARNTASSILDRIRSRKARQDAEGTIAELEQIINELIADRAEIVRIAQSFEQELVAQRISQGDITFIVNNVIPVIEGILEVGSGADSDPSAIQQQIDQLKPLLSTETVTIMQLLGFNFRQAIGEPLTRLVSHLILSKVDSSPNQDREIQRLLLENQQSLLEVSRDPEAYSRFVQLSGS